MNLIEDIDDADQLVVVFGAGAAVGGDSQPSTCFLPSKSEPQRSEMTQMKIKNDSAHLCQIYVQSGTRHSGTALIQMAAVGDEQFPSALGEVLAQEGLQILRPVN